MSVIACATAPAWSLLVRTEMWSAPAMVRKRRFVEESSQ